MYAVRTIPDRDRKLEAQQNPAQQQRGTGREVRKCAGYKESVDDGGLRDHPAEQVLCGRVGFVQHTRGYRSRDFGQRGGAAEEQCANEREAQSGVVCNRLGGTGKALSAHPPQGREHRERSGIPFWME
jgi:hypothetical protein